MPYEVICEPGTTVSVLDNVGDVKDGDQKVIGYWHEGRLYENGEIVPDEHISPVVVKLYDEGDPHTTSVLRRIDSKPAAVSEAAKSRSKAKVKEADEDDNPFKDPKPE